MVYAYALVVDFEIEPFPPSYAIMEDWDAQVELQYHNLPALLSVNKLVGAEARIVLYGQNRWRIPVHPLLNPPIIFTQYIAYFKSITMVFDQRELSAARKTAISRRHHSKTDFSSASVDVDGARARAIHSEFLLDVNDIWRQAWDSLSLHLGAVKEITIDLNNFACPSGCCRLKLLQIRSRPGLHAHFLKNLQPKKLAARMKKQKLPMPQVFIRGLLTQAERDLIIGDMGFTEAPRDEE